MPDGPEKEKLALLEILGRVPDRCAELEARAPEVLQQSREACETARYQKAVVALLPGDRAEVADYCRRAIAGWEAFERKAQQVLNRVGISTLGAMVSGNTCTATVGPAHLIQRAPLSAEARLAIERAESEYGNTARVDQAFEDIKTQMKRLRLDRGKAAHRRPLDLLEEAYLAIRYPASAQGGALSAVLSLRGSIERSIEELLLRRPVQEEAGNRRDRVLSIGRRFGMSGLAPAHFESLATDDESVNSELFDKGTKPVTQRPDLVRQFLRGAQFLRALLTSVDEALLRPSSAMSERGA